ncbi:porin [Azohydromonas caseinilytica]|uniref:Porin n=1 Tax=Azohydromonas caseinilytica TaxID=2728836 RepID=A0A848F5S8_9BURK|nr:porin [Azohydromonas caseinilytica]NML13461.1 porin [Azohydromonas caseinilytica]
MKKSLIALATLGAFAGAASAQSSVTLYGLVDLSVQHVKSGEDSPFAGAKTTRLSDGTAYGPGSRWGLRVSEDLGSGLKANVVLESGFGADDGRSQQSSRLFGRQAFVSLASTTLGEVRLGRQYTLHDETLSVGNPFGNTTVLNPGTYFNIGGASLANPTGAASVPLFIDNVRVDNAVQYISPSFAGFRVQGMVAAGEGTADRYQGLKGVYANGPLNVALSYEFGKRFTDDENVNKLLTLSANYDFGVVKVFAGAQRLKDPSFSAGNTLGLGSIGGATDIDKLTSYTVGASVPFGAVTVGANYSRAKYDIIGGGDETIGKFGVVGQYSLSKLTTVYAGYAQATGDAKNDVNEKRVFQVGLRKAF